MSLDQGTLEIAQRFKTRVTATCGPRILEVRVFGSRARGTSRAESDLDLFVMVDRADLALRAAISDAAWEVQYELDLPYSLAPLPMSREHFDDLLQRERMLARDIMAEGIAV